MDKNDRVSVGETVPNLQNRVDRSKSLFTNRRGDDEAGTEWHPACGLSVPQAPDWKLRCRLADDGPGESWLVTHKKSFENRVFRFILDIDTIDTLKWRALWVHRLKRNLSRCRRIVRVYAFDLEQRPHFIATAPESGKTLRDLPDISRLPLTLRLDIVAQIADTLAVAHNLGVIHGDLCPSNILVKFSSRGAPRIRLRNFAVPGPKSSPERTLYKRPVGEDEVADSDSTGVGSDIYALAVILFQMICGDLSKPLPAEWENNIDGCLRGILVGAISMFRSSRCKSLRDLAEELRNFESGNSKN
jgi:non-specific serine/threonine protein kinase